MSVGRRLHIGGMASCAHLGNLGHLRTHHGGNDGDGVDNRGRHHGHDRGHDHIRHCVGAPRLYSHSDIRRFPRSASR